MVYHHNYQKIEKTALSENENITSRLFYLENQYVNLQRKSQTRILLLTLFFGIFVMLFFTYELFYVQENKIELGSFVTQNLRGDSVDTWLYWNIPNQDNVFYINIINDAEINENKIKVIYDLVLSTESIQIDDSLLHKDPTGGVSNFYLGWAGAMNAAANIDTKYGFPTNFQIYENSSKDGNIVITLTKLKSTEGYTGYTRSLADKNQILKSYITIYEANILTEKQLAVILRHELGHAFGLIHSTDPDDLMHKKILTNVPYISECSIEALRELYNGNTEYSHTCQK